MACVREYGRAICGFFFIKMGDFEEIITDMGDST